MINFCHITPTPHLDLVDKRPVHLVLAHLVEQDASYVDFYIDQRNRHGCQIILDNSAFELYKRGLPMYPSEKLIAMATKVNADYIVMTDYPGEESEKTIEAAKKLAPEIHDAGFSTFFVPQSKVGDVKDCISAFRWASQNPKLVDYVGVSILTAPNAFGVEKGNKMQRFLSRLKLMYEMKESLIFSTLKINNKRVHFLGMVDGPNEIMYMSPFAQYIDTWDSSAAVWAGLNGIQFDGSPTGLLNGKFEEEVDFNFKSSDKIRVEYAKTNMEYIDRLCNAYLWR